MSDVQDLSAGILYLIVTRVILEIMISMMMVMILMLMIAMIIIIL